ncbi:hypothetical protein DFP72DRAFT_868706 [Ephemerocybe angulata]|uniref:DUF6535 domain-containing protein n=1 Tax=Ephemerocybe angulata TaxID=980116 RepID=A0A8H6IGM3_9AGAR|nr:hypothetical protein DFP72DRAFT_868706 [Tulosesus angulatus]
MPHDHDATHDTDLSGWDVYRCKPSTLVQARFAGQNTTIAGERPSKIRPPGNQWGAANEEWVDCNVASREHDKNITENWNKEMDNQLLFASLFSGIVSGFLLSATDFVRTDKYDSLHAKLSSIAVNVLWFASLIISLNSVLCAILVKQWLAEYAWEHDGHTVLSPRINFAVRHLRFERLHLSNMPTFIDYLPLQMIVGVGLFYAGLLAYMWYLNPIVAGIGTGLILASISIFFVTTYLPATDPLSPYQSIQAWIVRRAGEYIKAKLPGKKRQALRKEEDRVVPDGWVDHALMEVTADLDAKYETAGLLWLQGSLATWQPDLVKQSFGAALSLPQAVRAQTLVALCLEYIPKAGLESDDIRVMTDIAVRFGNTGKEKMFGPVYAALYGHLAILVESSYEPTAARPPSSETLLDTTRVLLITLQHPEWIQEEKAGGWSLMFSLVKSVLFLEIPYERRRVLSKRIFSTFLAHALAQDAWRDEDMGIPHKRPFGSRRFTDAQVQAMFFPKQWTTAPFSNTRNSYFEEELWILTTSCSLFGYLNFDPPDDTLKHQEAIKSCLHTMLEYLQGEAKHGVDGHLQNAMKLWTRILSQRTESGSYTIQTLLGGEDGEGVGKALREVLSALANIVAEDPNSQNLSSRLWSLRLLSGNAQVIHELFEEENLTMEPSDALKHVGPSKGLAAGIHFLEADEVLQVGETMLAAFPPAPWKPADLDYNYQHALITCFLFHTVSCNDHAHHSDLEVAKTIADLLVHDDGTIAQLSESNQKHLESALALSLARFANAFKTWQGDSAPPASDVTATRTVVLEAVVKESSKDRPAVFLALGSAALALLAPWTQSQVNEYPAMQRTLDAMASFLNRVDVRGVNRQRQPWLVQCLESIRDSFRGNPSAWTSAPSSSFANFIASLRERCGFSGWSDMERKALVDVLRESRT